MSSSSNGLRWGVISQQAGRVFSHWALSKPPASAHPPSSPKFIRAHDIMARKMLGNEEAGLDSASFRDLRSATDLALRATKATAQAIGRSMSSLIVLERHLWLTMTEMKEVDKVHFLNAPISSDSLFGPAVEGFAERFMEAQKSSQAMRHSLPKCISYSSATSCPRPSPTQQTAKPAPTALEPRPPEDRRDSSRSAWCYPFPKRQGSRPKIALDPAPQKSSWTAKQKEEGPESHYCWTTPQAASIVSLATPLSAEESVFMDPYGPTIAPRSPTAVIADKIKHIYFQKESKSLFLPTISVLPLCSQSAQLFQPLATRSEAWQAIPGLSMWVMTRDRPIYRFPDIFPDI